MLKRTLFAGALALAPFSALAAQYTNPFTVTTSAYVDLGAGPLDVALTEALGVQLVVADTQPAASVKGSPLASGATVPAKVTFCQGAHVWALATQGQTVVTATPANCTSSNANPTSTLTLPATTTAYAIGQLIANSATAGSVVVPSFTLANSSGGALTPRVRLTTNDATSTAWANASVQVDWWSAAPTFSNGDRAAFFPLTGTAGHLGAFTCVMSPEYGDGAYAECAPAVGSVAAPKLASGATVYWTLQALTASGVTGASKTFTLTVEQVN